MFFTTTGFDIGEKTLKMVQLQKGKLKKVAIADLPDNLISDGKALSMDALADFIAEAAKENGISKGSAAVILPASQTFCRTVTVPIMNERQIMYNIPYEFKDYLTEEKSSYIFDYEVLNTFYDEDDNPKEQQIFVCAVLKSLVESYKDMFAHAGFNLIKAVPEEYVYSLILRGDAGFSSSKNMVAAILDIGEASTRISIYNKGVFDTKRVIEMGISELERIIAREYDTDEHMARGYLLSNFQSCLSMQSSMEMYNRLAVEVIKAANFYNYNNRDVDLNDIYLIGGGAAIDELRQTLCDVSGLNIHSSSELFDGALDESWTFLRAYCCAVK